MSGRTSWFARDAAWHRRELIVELGEEFGAEGPFVVDVLSAWAQEQRAGGEVRGGFRTLARESFVTVSHAQSIVDRAASVGALDDLEVDPDGRRFRCRVSGWKSDQERGRAAARQETRRNSEKQESPEVTASHGESRSVTPSALPDQTIERVCVERTREDLGSVGPVSEVVEILGGCDRLRIDRVGVKQAIAAHPDRDPIKAARTAVTWATDPEYKMTNAAAVLESALSKQNPPAVSLRESEQAQAASRAAAERDSGLMAHFPNYPPFAVKRAARELSKPGEPATVEAIRAYLERAA